MPSRHPADDIRALADPPFAAAPAGHKPCGTSAVPVDAAALAVRDGGFA